MRRFLTTLLVLSSLFVVGFAAAAQARVRVEPQRVDFGRTSVACWQTDACPTQLVTVTNSGNTAITISSATTCTTVNPRWGCEYVRGWGGVLDDGTLEGCFGVLAPGDACSFTLVGQPGEVGRIKGYFIMESGESGNDTVVRIPITIIGIE